MTALGELHQNREVKRLVLVADEWTSEGSLRDGTQSVTTV
jgi:hypothetical protein